MEADWRLMGVGLGLISDTDISPCLDFDFKHEYAQQAIELYERIK
jgi:hypothetical protein